MRKIRNGSTKEFAQWYDTDGRIINASDGGVIFHEGKYYLYGQALRPWGFDTEGRGGQVTDKGVVMYSSEDLVNWKNEGVILAVEEDENSPLRPPLRFERPKIIFNEKTGKFVLWCHYIKYPGDHTFGEGGGEAGVAVADKVTGPYKFLGTNRPIDPNGVVRDCTLYKDGDGTAYFIYDRDETFDVKTRCIHIVKLSEDYLHPTDEYKRIGEMYRRESPAVFKRGEYYYMITSDMTGWEANKAKYFRAKSLMGEWEDMGDPYVGDTEENSFFSQTTYAFSPEGTEKVIHIAERHNRENFERCSYIWLPIDFDRDGRLSINYKEEIDLDAL